MAQRRVVGGDGVERIRAQHIKNAVDLRADRGAARLARDKTHLADRGVASKASHARGAAFAGVHHDADPAIQNKQHGIGGVTGAGDDLERADLDALAAPHEFGGIALIAEDPGKPALQIAFFLLQPAVPGDDFVLAPLQRVIEFGHHQNVARQKLSRPQHPFGRERQVDEDKLHAALDR